MSLTAPNRGCRPAVRALVAALGAAVLGSTALAGPVLDRVHATGTVRVCIWPAEQLRSIDIDLSAEFAQTLGAKLQYVDSSVSRLVEGLTGDRGDVSMHAVGVAPPRPFHVVPYAYAVKPGDDEWLREVDRFVAQVKRDGRLDAAAQRHGLGEIAVLP